MYIVLEYYLLENFIINFLILILTNVITKSKVPKRNIILGSIVCSLYSLVFFSPKLIFLTKFYMKIIISIVIVKLTFNSRNIKKIIYQLIGFYIISFVFAGAIIGISFNFSDISKLLFKKLNIIEIFKSKYVFIGLLIGILASYKIFTYYHERSLKEKYIANVTIVYREKEINVRALIDTGNSLVEPFTNKPVFVVEFEEIKEILPIKLNEMFLKEKIGNDLLFLEDVLMDLKDDIPLRLIPFRSIGNSSGLLLGFKPDYLRISLNSEKEILEKNIIVGIYNGELNNDLEYKGLLHYEIILQGDESWK